MVRRPAAAVRPGLAALALAVLAAGACESRTLVAYPDRLAGVGVVVTREAQGFVISRVLPGGPADEAGLQSGDRLLAVSGEDAEGRSLAQVVESLRGQPGTEVLVRVRGARGEAAVVLHRRVLQKGADGYEAK